MKTTLTLLLFIVFTTYLLTPSSFAQDRSDISGPSVITKHYTISEEPASKFVRSDTRTRQNSTDEYGESSSNGVLTGLNGAGNYANVPSSPAFDESFDGSIEMWIKPNVVTGTQQLISKGATSNFEFLLGLTSANLYFRIGNSVSIGTGTITAGVWTHVAVTWTGGGPYTVNFYVNGALSSTHNNTGVWPINTDPIKIGGPSGGFPGEVFNGQIDEVRFWTDVRTLAEIRDNRFVGIGDWAGANTANAITSGASYVGCNASWPFNTGGWDDIGLHDASLLGTATVTNVIGSQPIPYNFALMCPGTGNNTSYVQIPSSTAFNLTSNGTLDAWVYLNNTTGTQEIIAKGNTSNNQILWGINPGGLMYLRFGNTPAGNAGGIVLAASRWYHVAVSWTGAAGNYTLKFYVNGQKSGADVLNNGTMNIGTDPLTVGGGIAWPGEQLNGMIDEVRMWSSVLTDGQLKAYMHNSCRSTGVMANMVGAWGFDGNLIERSPTAGSDGTFLTGGVNNCRFSSFLNETSSGAPSTAFDSYATVVKKGDASFIGGFGMRSPNKPIVDVSVTRDTLVITGPGTTTSVELFIHAQHTFCADMDIVLISPNGQTRDICSDNGGGGNDMLTFFIDGATPPVTDATFFPPFSPQCAPEVAMGNMGGSPTNGAWILQITDDLGGDSGFLLGWGIRLNGTLTGIQPVTNTIPSKFELYQNYPNPFNPVTKIKFDLPKDGNVKLMVYDMLGKEVKTLVNEYSKAGQYEIPFDGSNLASGAYFFRIEAGSNVDVKKMMLVK